MARLEADPAGLGQGLGSATVDSQAAGPTSGSPALPTTAAVLPGAVDAAIAVEFAGSRWRDGLGRAGPEVDLALAAAAGLALVWWASGSRASTAAAVCILGVWAFGSYQGGRAAISPLSRPARTALRGVVPAMAAAAAGVGFLGLSPGVVRVAGVAVIAASAVSAAVGVARRRARGPVRLVVVGDRVGLPRGIGHLRARVGARTVGAAVLEEGVTSDDVDTELYEVPTAIGLDGIVDLVTETGSEAVVVSPGSAFTSADLKRLHHRLEAVPVAVGVLDVLECVAPHRIRTGAVGDATVLDIRRPRPPAWVRLVKVVVDRVGATVALVLAAPVLLALVVAVKTTSPGPAFFAQRRVGLGGRPFRLYKLRTMVHRADAEEGAEGAVHPSGILNDAADSLLFKLRHDPRTTAVGAFLRRYSLDELPQLWNVVRGDMSLVGPRPHLYEETARMDPDALRRLAVRPGLTGLWQVSGRSDLDWATTVRLDTFYADNWSLAGDLRILARTLPAVVRGRGAY